MNKNYLKNGLILLGSAAGLWGIGKKVQYQCVIKNLQQKLDSNIQTEEYELVDRDYSVFPWFFDKTQPDSFRDWEFRKVKIRGVLTENYFLIDRQKNGEDGYLVFGGLYTGLKHLCGNQEDDSDKYQALPKGLPICLGWVSRKDYKKGLKINYQQEDLQDLIQQEGFKAYEKHSGFYFDESNPEFKPLAKRENVVVITGILRREKSPSQLIGPKNDANQNFWSKIDLKKMVGYFGFSNFESEKYYIERISSQQEEENVIGLGTENLKDQIIINESLAQSKALSITSVIGSTIALSSLLLQK